MATKFTCSVDDGHPSDLKMAALLNKYDLNGTFYIPIRNREGPSVMSPSQVREISARFEIGSHTYDHCFLNSVNVEQALYQIKEGKKVLENLLGNSVAGFCYPGGKYNQKHADLVKEAGFAYARTTMNLCFDAGTDPFEIPTTCQFYPHDRSVYVRNFLKGGRWPHRLDGLVTTLKRHHWIERFYALFDYACETGGVFHLWMHSNDIERMNAWRELDFFFAYASSSVEPFNRLDNGQLASQSFTH